MKQIRNMIRTTTMPCWAFTPQLLPSFSMARSLANRYSLKIYHSFLLLIDLCLLMTPWHAAVSTGTGECGSGHSESHPYHPYSAHCWLLPEDQTAGQVLFTAGWCYGQERMHAGEMDYSCIPLPVFNKKTLFYMHLLCFLLKHIWYT